MDVRVQTVDGARATADGTPITVEGTVERVTHRGNLTIITISQPTSMDATVFEDLDTTTLTQGTCVRIVGKKDSYKGTAQLVASEVAVCEEGEHVRSG
jgi:DNA/RNA endonuclease YhcR with UshA esterase domain